MRQQQAFRALEGITEQANNHGGENSKTAAAQTEQSAKKKAAQEYNALKEKNPDFWGWIKINDTALSHPVMHTPEEPEYYLRRDFEGSIHCVAYRFWTPDVTTAAATTSSTGII